MEITLIPIDTQNLFQVVEYSDYTAGKIIRSIPVLSTGSHDPMRMETFAGATQLNTPNGPMRFRFQLKATCLEDAIAEFPEALKQCIEEAQSRALQNQIMSPIGNRKN